jgi:type VI secretion system protein
VARETSLLERIRHPEREDRRSIEPDFNQLAQSVLRNLERLLNSRHGAAPACMEYGIPSLEDVIHGGTESLRELTVDIKRTIETYEPRLRAVRVRLLPRGEEGLLLRYDITAELLSGGRRSRVHFESRVESSGRMSVRE